MKITIEIGTSTKALFASISYYGTDHKKLMTVTKDRLITPNALCDTHSSDLTPGEHTLLHAVAYAAWRGVFENPDNSGDWAFCITPNNDASGRDSFSQVWNRHEESFHESCSIADSMVRGHDGYPNKQLAIEAREKLIAEYEQAYQEYLDSLEPESGYDQ